jgi:hypothetical protein
MNFPETIPLLFRKYLANQCTPEEVDTLMTFLEGIEHKQFSSRLIESQVTQPLHDLYPADYALRYRLEQRLQEILEIVPATIPLQPE